MLRVPTLLRAFYRQLVLHAFDTFHIARNIHCPIDLFLVAYKPAQHDLAVLRLDRNIGALDIRISQQCGLYLAVMTLSATTAPALPVALLPDVPAVPPVAPDDSEEPVVPVTPEDFEDSDVPGVAAVPVPDAVLPVVPVPVLPVLPVVPVLPIVPEDDVVPVALLVSVPDEAWFRRHAGRLQPVAKAASSIVTSMIL